MTLRFVVLTHDHPYWHWDFMLEWNQALRTWRLGQDPLSTKPVESVSLAAHRIEYLEYEGLVSGGRGEVRRWDHGTYELIMESEHRIVIRLMGRKLNGVARIEEQDGAAFFQFTTTPPPSSEVV